MQILLSPISQFQLLWASPSPDRLADQIFNGKCVNNRIVITTSQLLSGSDVQPLSLMLQDIILKVYKDKQSLICWSTLIAFFQTNEHW